MTPAEAPALTAEDEQFLADLSDRNNAVRQQIISALVDGVYAQTINSRAFECMDELLRLCNGDPALLSRMLRTSFIQGQTPVYWIFTNLPREMLTSAPPLWARARGTALPVLERIENACGPLIEGSAPMEDLKRACRERNGNALFQQVNPRKASAHVVQEYTVEVDEEGVEPGVGLFCIVTFSIPGFAKRMNIEEIVELSFLARGRFWSFKFTAEANGIWQGRLALDRHELPIGSTKVQIQALNLGHLGKYTTRATLEADPLKSRPFNLYFSAWRNHISDTGMLAGRFLIPRW